ncbi:unnamed protein product, partial [Rotaria magnacalcarata]
RYHSLKDVPAWKQLQLQQKQQKQQQQQQANEEQHEPLSLPSINSSQ